MEPMSEEESDILVLRLNRSTQKILDRWQIPTSHLRRIRETVGYVIVDVGDDIIKSVENGLSFNIDEENDIDQAFTICESGTFSGDFFAKEYYDLQHALEEALVHYFRLKDGRAVCYQLVGKEAEGGLGEWDADTCTFKPDPTSVKFTCCPHNATEYINFMCDTLGRF